MFPRAGGSRHLPCRTVTDVVRLQVVARTDIEDETVEFSRRIAVASAEIDGLTFESIANADERSALARRFQLEAMERLSVTARLAVMADDRIRARVTFEADVVQSCVVTLEPVATTITETFSVDFAVADAVDTVEEIVFEFEDEDPPEAVVDGHIDLGEVVAQHLSTVIDPYPRHPEAVVEVTEAGENAKDDAPGGSHPFAALARLRTED